MALPKSNDEWDQATSNDTMFNGLTSDGEASPEVKEVYRDLSVAVLGKEFLMSSGYGFDQDYFQQFGVRHGGIDIDAPAGTPIYAAVGGKVHWAGGSFPDRAIIIEDTSGNQWVYGHVQSTGTFQKGTTVTAGQQIATVGDQGGNSHLHLGVLTDSFGDELDRWGRWPTLDEVKQHTMSPLQAFSAQQKVSSQPDINHAPVVTSADQTLASDQWSPVAGWFSATDADGDAITQWALWDSNHAANSGHFWVFGRGHQPAGQWIVVSSAELPNTWFGGGNGPGSETLYISAKDGTQWSALDDFVVTTQGSGFFDFFGF